MNKTLNIIISAVMWCAIAAYIIVTSGYSRDLRAEATVRELRIEIAADTSATKVVSHAMVSQWLAESGIDPVGQPVAAADTRAIEEHIAARPEVRHVSAWTDLRGVMTVRVEQRTPVMRIRSTGISGIAHRFWFTADGYILPDRGDFSAYVPVITGNIPFPFGASANGSYEDMQRANYNDFLGRFAEIEAERRSLSARRSEIRTEISATRASGPRRWWGTERKKNFNQVREASLAELRTEEASLDVSLASLEAKKRALAEKEKKSYQSYRFLPKLANFVEFIERDDFWTAQIVQINVLWNGGAAARNEPQLELIPRAGDHTILLGALYGDEKEKLDKLRIFYSDGLWHEGWDRYSYIDIKYKDQIVCTK